MRDGREMLSQYHWLKRRREVCLLAGERCEQCGIWTPLKDGEAHHVVKRGMGAGFRDDRASNLRWLCRMCHKIEHGSDKSTRGGVEGHARR